MALEDMTKLFMSLGSIAIILVVAFLVVAQGISQAETAEGLDYSGGGGNLSTTANATMGIQTAMNDAVDWLPIIIITVIGALLIGLVAFFRGRR